MSKTNSTPCRFAYKYIKGRRAYDRRHVCKPTCQETDADCIAWCNRTPYPTQDAPPVQIEHVPCECGKPYVAHITLEVTEDGWIRGYSLNTDCGFAPHPWPTRHLLSCDCLSCVSNRVTADRAAAENRIRALAEV